MSDSQEISTRRDVVAVCFGGSEKDCSLLDLPIAKVKSRCQTPAVKLSQPLLFGAFSLLVLPVTGQEEKIVVEKQPTTIIEKADEMKVVEQPKAAVEPQAVEPSPLPTVEPTPEQLPVPEPMPVPEAMKGGIPKDLIDDEHVREELAVNEFTAPSISKLFDTLQFLMPLPIAEVERKMPARMSQDRADLAIELGFLIADGFLVVQAEQLDKVEELAKDLTRYGKALGAGDRVNRHAASLLDSAKKRDVVQLKKELSATQRDVEGELVTLRDADLAHLISLGGWIRALEVSTVAVDKQFSVERARKVMREDIADYYTESVSGLEPRISERANYLAMRDLLAGLRTEMVVEDGKEPTQQMMAEIRKQAAKLVGLALQRQK